MGNLILQLTRSVAVLPILAMGLTSPFVSANVFQPSLGGMNMVQGAPVVQTDEQAKEEGNLLAEHAEKIDAYFKNRSMPLYGFGKKMAEEAESHDLDWRLLPAISVRESSGGKEAFSYNPFGWGKEPFRSFNEAIEVVARNLGGDNPSTADYYSGETKLKLYYYNGTVIPTYTKEVLSIMDDIGDK